MIYAVLLRFQTWRNLHIFFPFLDLVKFYPSLPLVPMLIHCHPRTASDQPLGMFPLPSLQATVSALPSLAGVAGPSGDLQVWHQSPNTHTNTQTHKHTNTPSLPSCRPVHLLLPGAGQGAANGHSQVTTSDIVTRTGGRC